MKTSTIFNRVRRQLVRQCEQDERSSLLENLIQEARRGGYRFDHSTGILLLATHTKPGFVLGKSERLFLKLHNLHP